MNKRILCSILFLTGIMVLKTTACTNLIVGKDASIDGSVMSTYCFDNYGLNFGLPHYPAATHAPGEMREVKNIYSRIPHGTIPEAKETYNVIGNMNEWQVTITETTFNVDKSLIDSTANMDYPTLIFCGLQRAKTAREAIRVMTSLAEKHGFLAHGEAFTICDPNEAWIMEMVSCGRDSHTAVWVAVRIPDNAISGHANQSRIRTFDMKDKKNVMYSKNVIQFARQTGRFSGKDSEFSFRDAYQPVKFSGRRMCDARVWSFFNRFSKEAVKWEPWALGIDPDAEEMPLWIVPDRKVSVQDLQEAMRDHYEGTAMDPYQDVLQGSWPSPYRPSAHTFKVDGKTYFTERTIATPQSTFCFVSQMRSWLPRQIGGVLWWGNDDSGMVPQTPVYCCATRRPPCYIHHYDSDIEFSMDNAFWVQNWVSNMVYPRYSMLFPDLKQVRDSLNNSYFAAQPQIEAQAMELLKKDPSQAVEFLTAYTTDKAQQMMESWRRLAFYLIVKYNDMSIKPEKDGKYLRTNYGRVKKLKSVAPSKKLQEEFVRQTGDKYRYRSYKKTKDKK